MDDLQLMVELSTFEDVDAFALTDADHVAGDCPDWAEIVLRITRSKKQLDHYLRRHDGEAIILALLKVLHPNAGKSVSGNLWAEVDQAMVDLLDGDLGKEDRLKTQGFALGLSTAIALIRHPANPDVDAVRKEAMERYEASAE